MSEIVKMLKCYLFSSLYLIAILASDITIEEAGNQFYYIIENNLSFRKGIIIFLIDEIME